MSTSLSPLPARDVSRISTTSSGRDSATIVDRPSIDNRDVNSDDVNSEFHHEAYGPDPGDKDWDAYEVRLAPDSLEHPHNWSRARRWYLTCLSGLLVFNAYVYLPVVCPDVG